MEKNTNLKMKKIYLLENCLLYKNQKIAVIDPLSSNTSNFIVHSILGYEPTRVDFENINLKYEEIILLEKKDFNQDFEKINEKILKILNKKD